MVQLCLVIQNVWDDIPQARITHLSPFMPRRCLVAHEAPVLSQPLLTSLHLTVRRTERNAAKNFLANDDSRQIADLALTKQFLRVVFTIIKFNIEIDVRFCFLFMILRIAIGTQSWFHYPLLSESCFESHWISCIQVNFAEHSWCMKALVVGKLYRHAKLISIIPQIISYTCWKEIVTGYFDKNDSPCDRYDLQIKFACVQILQRKLFYTFH